MAVKPVATLGALTVEDVLRSELAPAGVSPAKLTGVTLPPGVPGLGPEVVAVRLGQPLADDQPQPQEQRQPRVGQVRRELGDGVHQSVLEDVGRVDPSADPAVQAGVHHPPQPRPVTPPSDATRAAMWRHAGLERTPEGLRTLQDDPHPLARLVATAALARQESRGAHRRTDFPGMEPSWAGVHTVLSAAGAVALEPWS